MCVLLGLVDKETKCFVSAPACRLLPRDPPDLHGANDDEDEKKSSDDEGGEDEMTSLVSFACEEQQL